MDPLKLRCSVKLVINVLALTVLASCAADVVSGGEAQGIIRVFNEIRDPVTMSNCRDFIGRRLPAGIITIGTMREIEWSFWGYPTVNRDWTCRFQWTDSSDCGSATTNGPCRAHGRVVRLWSSVCRDCVWRTNRKGFYRRDWRVQSAHWQFMFGWN